MKKILVLCLCLALAAGLGWWGFRKLTGSSQASYRTAPLKVAEIVSTVSSTGTLTPVVNVQVGTPVSGIVKQLFVDYNSPVKTGQAIAQIDPAIFKAQAEQAEGNYMAAKANVAKAKATELDASRTLARYAKLVKAGLLAQSDYDTADTALKTAQAGVKAAEASVVQTKGAFEQASTNLDYSTIRSPVDGIVISRNVDVGQTVAASLQSPTLFVIAQDLAQMEIDTSVDEADVSKLREGTPATFTVDAYPDVRFQGKVTQVRNSPVTVQNVVTYVVVIGVDNQDLRLKPGMTANVTFEVARKKGVLTAPNAALRFRPKDGAGGEGAGAAGQQGRQAQSGKGQVASNRIYLLGEDGKPKMVRVNTGIGNDKDTEVIAEGLKEGDPVIVEQLGAKPKAGGAGGPPMGPRF